MTPFTTKTRFAAGAFAGTLLAVSLTLTLLDSDRQFSTSNQTGGPSETGRYPCVQNKDTFDRGDFKKEFVSRWLKNVFNSEMALRNFAEARKVTSPAAWRKFESLFGKSKMPTYLESTEYVYSDRTVTSYGHLVGLTAEDPYFDLDMDFEVSGTDSASYKIESIIFKSYGKQNLEAALHEFFESEIEIGLDSSAQDLYFAAKASLSKHDREGAVELYGKAIRKNPKFFLAYFCRGFERSVLGDHKGAVEDYSSAISINPRFVGAYQNRGFEFDEHFHSYKKAYRDFSEVIQLEPHNVLGYTNRANSLCALKDFVGAVRDCDQALRLYPDSGKAHGVRAYAYSNLGDKYCAISDATAAIENYNSGAWVLTVRGNAREVLGYTEDAVKDYDRAINDNPKYFWAYSSRGEMRSKSGDHAGALEDHNLAIGLEPTFADAFCLRGQAFARMGDHVAAVKDFDKALKLQSGDVSYLAKRAISKLAVARYADAKADLDEAIAISPSLALPYYHRALANWRMHNYEGAVSDAVKFLRVSWYHPQRQSAHGAFCHHGPLDATSVAILIPTLVLLALIIAAAHKKHLFPWQEPLAKCGAPCKHCRQ